VLVGVRVEGGDAGRRGALMEAYKREDGMIVIEMTPDEAEVFARRMAESTGLPEGELVLVVEEVHG